MFGNSVTSIKPVEYGAVSVSMTPVGPRSRFFNPYPVELYATQ